MTTRCSRQLVRRCQLHAQRTDVELSGELLGQHPVHVDVDSAQRCAWASAAADYGAELAHRDSTHLLTGAPSATVEHRYGGVGTGRVLLAEYRTRPPGTIVYDDAIAQGEWLIEELGWREWYPPDCLARIAVEHESAHRLLCGRDRRQLNARIGRTVLRLGSRRWYAHVAGTDEIAAHAYAAHRCGLRRSPVLLTIALSELVTEWAYGSVAGHTPPTKSSFRKV